MRIIALVLSLLSQGVPLVLHGVNFTAFSKAGYPLRGGKVYVYSDVPVRGAFGVSYWDEDCTMPNTNPVVLDWRGQARIWFKHLSSYTERPTLRELEKEIIQAMRKLDGDAECEVMEAVIVEEGA